ncbi:hypothetical protein SVAN01_00215 [Stagonosporopsis vannaccii]|nr:hypothetical protein SVAN01_00215 [Stagonosporopsis vannaccii]
MKPESNHSVWFLAAVLMSEEQCMRVFQVRLQKMDPGSAQQMIHGATVEILSTQRSHRGTAEAIRVSDAPRHAAVVWPGRQVEDNGEVRGCAQMRSLVQQAGLTAQRKAGLYDRPPSPLHSPCISSGKAISSLSSTETLPLSE